MSPAPTIGLRRVAANGNEAHDGAYGNMHKTGVL